MSPRQIHPNNENKEEGATKIQETNLNLGLVNFQQESFNFSRVHCIFIIMVVIIFLFMIWRRKEETKKRNQPSETGAKTNSSTNHNSEAGQLQETGDHHEQRQVGI